MIGLMGLIQKAFLKKGIPGEQLKTKTIPKKKKKKYKIVLSENCNYLMQ